MFVPDLHQALLRVRGALKTGARFAALVWSTEEKNPYIGLQIRLVREMGRMPSPPPTLALGGDAKDAIYGAVRNTIELFLKQGTKSRSAAALKTYDSFVWNIAWYFTNFLTVGLAKGDAPWP